MAKRLKINLLPTWSDKSGDSPQGPWTYVRHASANPGALQVSWARYTRPGPPLEMSDERLVSVVRGLAAKPGAQILSQSNGNSIWGRFGCVVATTPKFRFQAWLINKGPDNVLVTHTAPLTVDEEELSEAEQIAMGIYVAEGEGPSTAKPLLQ